ncbi:hypothetical protein KKA93_03150 [Patescibacteria group bacterium]|nr:hypothetical protein [Patescibacteria group bacterium]MBU1663056.1 hypothetical protein [Patescibacteria group bacterium]MBU1933625.1 hypothetical protein [Patescibacteria group bacterium]MBU2233854.1 hypothetical protein [Patescibacteria group bacterium]MBU2264270.1 hypothetical protein [Patescibacteria group bacterium]
MLMAPVASQAADATTFKPQVAIPGMEAPGEFVKNKTGSYTIPGSTESIAKYIRVIYKYAIGLVGILAAVVLMIGGVMWIVAGGNATAIGEAKAWIIASLTGLILALCSYLILATINPALVELKTTPVQKVTPIIATDSPMSERCCKDENDAQCTTPGYVCNMYAKNPACEQRGICMSKQEVGGVCENEADCKNGLICKTNRCANAPDTSCANKDNGASCDPADPTQGYCYDHYCAQCNAAGQPCEDVTMNYQCVDEQGRCGESHHGDCAPLSIWHPLTWICYTTDQ